MMAQATSAEIHGEPFHTTNALTARISAIEHQTARGLGTFDPVADLFQIKENTRDEIRALGSFGSRVRNGRNPGHGAGGLSATPVTALSSIQTPTARIRDQTIPIPEIISSGTRCAARLPVAPIPACRAQSPIAAATAAGITATEDLRSCAPLAGAVIHWRYPSPELPGHIWRADRAS